MVEVEAEPPVEGGGGVLAVEAHPQLEGERGADDGLGHRLAVPAGQRAPAISTTYLHYLQHIYTISTLHLHISTKSTHLSTLAMAGVVGVTQLEVNSPLLLPPSQSDSIDTVDISLLSPATWYEHVVRAAGGHPRPRVVVGGGAADLEGVRVGAGVPGDAAVALLPPDAHLQCCMSPATTPPTAGSPCSTGRPGGCRWRRGS